MDYVIWVMVGYVSGSIPTGYWIDKLKGIYHGYFLAQRVESNIIGDL